MTWSFLCLSCHILPSKYAYILAIFPAFVNYQSYRYSQMHNILELVQRSQCCLSLKMWLFLLHFNSCYFINFVTRTFLFVFSYTDTPLLRRCSYVPEGQAKIGIECVGVCVCVCVCVWSCTRTQGSSFKIQTRAHWNLNGRRITPPPPAYCVIAQQYSHATFVSFRPHSRKEKLGGLLFFCQIAQVGFRVPWNCVESVSVGTVIPYQSSLSHLNVSVSLWQCICCIPVGFSSFYH